MKYYTLDDEGRPVVAPSVIEWGRWFESANRNVAVTTIGHDDDYDKGAVVSTVFVGVDRQSRSGPPLLFETYVYGGGELDGFSKRYASIEEARTGHDAIVERVIFKWAR